MSEDYAALEAIHGELVQALRAHIRDMEGMHIRLLYYRAKNELDEKRIDEITERLGDTIRQLKAILGEP